MATDRMKTQQSSLKAAEDPSRNHHEIYLLLAHPKCGTRRTFVITDSLLHAMSGFNGGLSVESICEVCDQPILVQIQLGEPSKTWSGNPILRTYGHTVEDGVGLPEWPEREEE